MKNTLLSFLLISSFLWPYGCGEIQEFEKGIIIKNEYADKYATSLSDNFNLFAVHLKNHDFSFSDRSIAYTVGLSFSDNFKGDEKIAFEKAYKETFNFTLIRYVN